MYSWAVINTESDISEYQGPARPASILGYKPDSEVRTCSIHSKHACIRQYHTHLLSIFAVTRTNSDTLAVGNEGIRHHKT